MTKTEAHRPNNSFTPSAWKGSDAPKAKWNGLIDVLRDVIFANELYLSEHERGVLLFIFKRTRMFGKEWERIPLRHFTDGVWSRDNGQICCSTGFNTNSVSLALKHLHAKGVILKREHPTRATEYRIPTRTEIAVHDIIGYVVANQPSLLNKVRLQLRRNEPWLPSQFLEALTFISSKIKKGGLRTIARDSRTISGRIPIGISRQTKQIKGPRIEKGNKTENVAQGATSSGFLYIKGKRVRIIRKSSSIHEDKLNAVKALTEAHSWQNEKREQRTATGVRLWKESWREAMETSYPDAIVEFPDKAFRNLRLAVDERGLPSTDVAPLLAWTVKNWMRLRTTLFTARVGRPFGPEAPDINYLIAALPRVHRAYFRERHPFRYPAQGRPNQGHSEIRANDPFSLANQQGRNFP